MEYLIRDAKIIDGSGKDAYRKSFGICDGKIVLNDLPGTADQVIDGTGLTVTPGFIDAHSHGDMALGTDYGSLAKLNQGITTEIAGQCGNSQAPVSKAFAEDKIRMLKTNMSEIPEEIRTWDRWSKYASYAESKPKHLNFGGLVGFNTIRMAVMGLTDRKPTRGEVREMQELLIEAMENGAFGMSSGLAYVPGAYTDTEDVAEIAKVMADYGGIYATHMRNESFDLIPSVKEAIEIGEKAGVSVHISHFKAMGRPNWGKVSPAIEEVEKARLRGLRVTADQYPYNCSMSALYPCVPPHYFTKGMEEALKSFTDPAVRASIKAEMDDPSTPYENFYLNSGGFSGVTICTADATKEAEGLTVEAYAKKRNMDPYDAFFDLLIENHGNVSADYHSIGEDDILSIAALPFVAIGTDGLVRSMDAKCHPRGWGTMVHAIMEFTRNHPILSLEEVIRKMTSLPAEIYGIKDRGLIREGYRADLVVIDESLLNDRATYQEPNRVALGIPYVFVGGKIALRDGALTGVTNGVFLRKTGR